MQEAVVSMVLDAIYSGLYPVRQSCADVSVRCGGGSDTAPPSGLARPRRRLTELMVKAARERRPPAAGARTWSLRFLRSPVAAHGDAAGRVTELELAVNRLDGDRVTSTAETERLPCQLLLTSTGSVVTARDGSHSSNPNSHRRYSLKLLLSLIAVVERVSLDLEKNFTIRYTFGCCFVIARIRQV